VDFELDGAPAAGDPLSRPLVRDERNGRAPGPSTQEGLRADSPDPEPPGE